MSRCQIRSQRVCGRELNREDAKGAKTSQVSGRLVRGLSPGARCGYGTRARAHRTAENAESAEIIAGTSHFRMCASFLVDVPVPLAETVLAPTRTAPETGTGRTSKHRVANSTMRWCDAFAPFASSRFKPAMVRCLCADLCDLRVLSVSKPGHRGVTTDAGVGTAAPQWWTVLGCGAGSAPCHPERSSLRGCGVEGSPAGRDRPDQCDLTLDFGGSFDSLALLARSG